MTNHPCPSFRKGGEKLAYLKKRGEVSLHGKEVSLHGKEGEKSACMVKEGREYIYFLKRWMSANAPNICMSMPGMPMRKSWKPWAKEPTMRDSTSEPTSW